MPKDPPFDITPEILSYVADISELVGKIGSTNNMSATPTLRRENRIRTIHGSLAIEQNTLSIEQVTAVINGKHIIAPPKDIAEVKNAYEIYDRMEELDPYSVDDLLLAHGVMMRGLIDEAGVFRSGPVGVADRDGHILHFGTLPDYVPGLVCDLLGWARESRLHMLIKSCVLHYELELIHPFADGNGRTGRLWHTLMLSKWNSIFAWLPVESIVNDRQKDYYDAINASNIGCSSTKFITFMLSSINSSLIEASEMIDEMIDEPCRPAETRWRAVKAYLEGNTDIRNAELCGILKVSPATANRLLRSWCEDGKLERYRDGRTWAYRLSVK